MNKRQDVTEQTRKNLKESFWSLYIQKPIEKITVKEITNYAGYNRGTFYLYYKDTYDILSQIEDELLGVIHSLITKWLKEDALHNLSLHMGYLIELGQTYSSYMGVLLSDKGDPKFASQLKDLLRPLISCWLHLEQANPVQAQFISDFYCAGLLSVISKWLCDPQGIQIEQFVQFIAQQLFPFQKVEAYH